MTVEEVLKVYARIARPVILEYFRKDSCIASTRITVEVFSRLGFKAMPFPCTVQIYNNKFREIFEREKHWPTKKEMGKWVTKGAWGIGIGFGDDRKEGYLGHMVAIVENRYLVDSSLDQAERPNKEIYLPAILVTEVNRDFRRGKKELTIVNERGTVMVYEPRIKDRKWEATPDWTKISRHTPAIERILFELRKELEFESE
jgi:hypothetical protein